MNNSNTKDTLKSGSTITSIVFCAINWDSAICVDICCAFFMPSNRMFYQVKEELDAKLSEQLLWWHAFDPRTPWPEELCAATLGVVPLLLLATYLMTCNSKWNHSYGIYCIYTHRVLLSQSLLLFNYKLSFNVVFDNNKELKSIIIHTYTIRTSSLI